MSSEAVTPLPREFRRYLVAVFLTVTGNWAQNIALALVAYKASSSALVAGVAISARQLPLLIAAPYAGRFLDRHNRASVVALCEAGAGLATLALAASAGTVGVSTPMILGFGVVTGAFNVFDNPGREALIGDLVAPEQISKAAALTQTTGALARVIGPAVAALVLAVGTSTQVFFLNAASFALTAALFHSLRTALIRDNHEVDLEMSARMAIAEAGVASSLVLITAVAVLVLNTQAALLALAENLGATATQYGVLIATMGAGGVIGALSAGKIKRPSLSALRVLTFALAGTLVLIAAAPSVIVLGSAATLGGLLAGAFATSSSAHLQLAADPRTRGRLLATYAACFTGAAPLGAPLAGFLSDVVGTRPAFAALACGLTAAAVASFVLPSARPVSTNPLAQGG